MDNIIHLEELILAKKVCEDFPGAIRKIDICHDQLYNYKEYIDIMRVIRQLEESKYMMELTLEVYTEVLKNARGLNEQK